MALLLHVFPLLQSVGSWFLVSSRVVTTGAEHNFRPAVCCGGFIPIVVDIFVTDEKVSARWREVIAWKLGFSRRHWRYLSPSVRLFVHREFWVDG